MQVLLLDEITVDLDVLGRADLLAYLRAETEERGACIVYATHIFDGLESWATHLMYLADGGLKASCWGCLWCCASRQRPSRSRLGIAHIWPCRVTSARRS